MNLDLEFRDGLCIVTLMHGYSNSLSISFLEEILCTLIYIEEMRNVKVVVISSAHSNIFSSGLDLRSLICDEKMKISSNIFNAISLVYKINVKILSSEKIYIASTSGAVIGSAASLTFSCDLRIGTKETWFWLPDPQYGGLLIDGGLDLLKGLVGISRAKIISLTNNRINSNQACEWGLIYNTVEKSELNSVVISEAERMASYSYNTLKSTKAIMNQNIIQRFNKRALKKILKCDEMYERLLNYFKRKTYF